METKNFMDVENIVRLLKEVDAYNVKYWYENYVCGGTEFERLSEALFNIDEDEYLWTVADYISSELNEEEFLEVIRDEDWDVSLDPAMRFKKDSLDTDVEFVNCTIRYKDDKKFEDATIAVGITKEELEDEDNNYLYTDEDIFFYAEDIDEVINLFNNDNGEDFIIFEYDTVE